MKHAHVIAFLVTCLGVPSGLSAGQATPRYTNAELVSVNTQTRLVVIKGADGRAETLKLDDGVTGLEGLRAGDRVMVTVRGEPGMSRVRSIVKSVATTTAAPKPPAASRRPAEDVPAVAPALRTFADQVSALAEQAGQVDSLWNNFRTSCNVTLRSSYPEGRGWFSIWDSAAQMDVTGGSCRDLFNQVVEQGETVKKGMAGAEEAARTAALTPGDLREVRRRYSMEWGGWSLPAPDPLKL
jgi:hypothetical protein